VAFGHAVLLLWVLLLPLLQLLLLLLTGLHPACRPARHPRPQGCLHPQSLTVLAHHVWSLALTVQALHPQ
jgi:hypothetical protein